jgi:hypothetical protein
VPAAFERVRRRARLAGRRCAPNGQALHWLKVSQLAQVANVPYGSATSLPFCRAMPVTIVSAKPDTRPIDFRMARDPQAFSAKARPNPLDVFG